MTSRRQYDSGLVLDPRFVAALSAANIAVQLVPHGGWAFEPGEALGPQAWFTTAAFAHEPKASVTAPVVQGFAEAPSGPAVAVCVALTRLASACRGKAADLREGAKRLSEALRAEAFRRADAYDAEARVAFDVAAQFAPAAPPQVAAAGAGG